MIVKIIKNSHFISHLISFPSHLKLSFFCAPWHQWQATELSGNSKERKEKKIQNKIKTFSFSFFQCFYCSIKRSRYFFLKTFDVNSAVIPFVLSEVYFIQSMYVHTYFILWIFGNVGCDRVNSAKISPMWNVILPYMYRRWIPSFILFGQLFFAAFVPCALFLRRRMVK